MGKIIEVDARGLACPLPVVKTKKALEGIEEGEVITIVDNEVAKDNVVKLAQSLGCQTEVKQENGFYRVHIRKEGVTATQLSVNPGQLIFINSSHLGRGSDELGSILMRSFLFSLTEMEVKPQRIIFMNSGVHLCCEGSPVLDSLLALEEKGVEILVCGTCLDYFQLKEKLCVGKVTNMYSSVEHLLAAEKVITI